MGGQDTPVVRDDRKGAPHMVRHRVGERHGVRPDRGLAVLAADGHQSRVRHGVQEALRGTALRHHVAGRDRGGGSLSRHGSSREANRLSASAWCSESKPVAGALGTYP